MQAIRLLFSDFMAFYRNQLLYCKVVLTAFDSNQTIVYTYMVSVDNSGMIFAIRKFKHNDVIVLCLSINNYGEAQPLSSLNGLYTYLRLVENDPCFLP